MKMEKIIIHYYFLSLFFYSLKLATENLPFISMHLIIHQTNKQIYNILIIKLKLNAFNRLIQFNLDKRQNMKEKIKMFK